MKTLTTVTISASNETLQSVNVPDIETAKSFIQAYADGQCERFWKFQDIEMMRYSIDHFEIEDDGEYEETYSREYVQTVSNFKVEV